MLNILQVPFHQPQIKCWIFTTFLFLNHQRIHCPSRSLLSSLLFLHNKIKFISAFQSCIMLIDTLKLSRKPSTLKNSPLNFNTLLLLFFKVRQPVYSNDSFPLASCVWTITSCVILKYRCIFLVTNIYIVSIQNRLFQHKWVIRQCCRWLFLFQWFIKCLVKRIVRIFALWLLRNSQRMYLSQRYIRVISRGVRTIKQNLPKNSNNHRNDDKNQTCC